MAAGAGIFVVGAYSLLALLAVQPVVQQRAASSPPRSRRAIRRRNPFDLAVISAAFVGALVGFLWWQAPRPRSSWATPARWRIGGVVAAMSILTRTELLAVLIAGVFIIGPGSVIVQRLYFKLTRGKRIFLMSPFHPPPGDARLAEVTIVGAVLDHRPDLARRLRRRILLRRMALARTCDVAHAGHPHQLERRLVRPAGRRARSCRSPASRSPTPSAELGADVLVVAAKAARRSTRGLLPVIGARLWTGALDRRAGGGLATFAPEVVVASPGFAPRHPADRVGAQNGIALWGDVELAWRVRDKVVRADGSPADWILVTGTNGKTTTTRARGDDARGGRHCARRPCGNIGTPVLDAVRDPSGFDALVVELLEPSALVPGAAGLGPIRCRRTPRVLPEPRRRPPGVARLVRGRTAPPRRTCTTTRASPASTTRRMPPPCAWSRTPRSSRARAPSASTWAMPGPSDLGVVDGHPSWTARSSRTARTSALELDHGRRARLAGARGPAHRRQHPGRERPRAVAGRRARRDPRCAAGLPARPAPHRGRRVGTPASPGSTTPRPPTRTPPHRRWRPTRRRGGRRRTAQGRRHLRARRPAAAPSAEAAIVIGVDREAVVAAFERHAPAVPVFEVEADETEGVMAQVVELAARGGA